MEFNNIESESEMDYILDNHISNLYIKFKEYDKITKGDIFKFMVRDPQNGKINIYSLYSLYIMDTVDGELKKDIFFDQEYGFVPLKSNHREGNEYMSTNEIQAVIGELETKPTKISFSRHIITRIRVLSIMDIWNNKVDCETLIFKGEETDNFKKEFKRYIFDNPRYLRYSRLLKASLDSAKMFEHPEPLPKNMKELNQFLKNPLVYVILEPYNYIIGKDLQDAITTGTIIGDEVIIHKI